ncbi:uncharacterized protein LOC131670546 [Phymastichus coffea]|uniref:uncharacterized protein LOC131670546 n=1 Tax=Phymastichus coffea TaxID=108790 RepID=UPI00273AED78|nr:uncharacterized protein LOC131670546 [Phymastichus coffea]
MESNEKLVLCMEKKDWDTLVTILKPKDFCGDIPRTFDDFYKLLKVAELLTETNIDLPEKIKAILLKCVANSCVNGFTEKAYTLSDVAEQSNFYRQILSKVSEWTSDGPYPFHINFPYEGVVRWAIQTIVDYSEDNRKLNEEQIEVLRLSLQLLCNFFTFAFNIEKSANADLFMTYIKDKKFKDTIIKLVGHDRAPIARAACAYVHNMVRQVFKEFYGSIDKKELTSELIKSIISDIQAALDTVTLLLKEPSYLKEIYEELSIDDKLYLIDIIHQEVRAVVYNEEKTKDVYGLPIEAIEFLADKFKKKSDLILKTVDTYLNGLEPTEITILIDILGVLTSNPKLEESKKLQEDKSLLINCLYLLKAVHIIGKNSNNCFTPLQKLSELTVSNEKNCYDDADNKSNHVCTKTIQSHPAFGFKASLIRLIGNLVHKNEKNQNFVRENDGIPLLLDCCNLDARNPLIIQWTTLAIRNLLENNQENQDVVRESTKLGVVDSSIAREFGLTLHDEGDGKAIGIMPLPKKD